MSDQEIKQEPQAFQPFDSLNNVLYNEMVINPFQCKVIAIDRIFDTRFATYRIGITPLVDIVTPNIAYENRSPGIGIAPSMDLVDYLILGDINSIKMIKDLNELPFDHNFLFPSEEVKKKSTYHQKIVVVFNEHGAPDVYAHNIRNNCEYQYMLMSAKNLILDKKNEMLQKNIVQTFMLSLGAMGGMQKTPGGIIKP